MNLRIPSDPSSAQSFARAWPEISEAFDRRAERRTEEMPGQVIPLARDMKDRKVEQMVRTLHRYGVDENYLRQRFGLTGVRIRAILGDGFE